MKKYKRILVLCPFPVNEAAGQRLKYEQYFPLLGEYGYKFTISNFQTKRMWDIAFQPGRLFEKAFWTCIGYAKRVFDLFRVPFYDAVYVFLWVTPMGIPIFEHLVLKLNPNVIYDIDDMIFLKQVEHVKENIFQRMKGRNKPIVMMKNAKYVIVCTPKLEEIALELNKNKQVIDISSTLNTDWFLPVQQYVKNSITTLGWTGTYSTFPFLDSLREVLLKVQNLRQIRLLVISNRPYKMDGIETELIYWKKETEVLDLHRIEIGLYPIPTNEWSLGKSSLKALTYMANAIPVVTPAYGTNFRVIENGIDGFLVNNEEEWVQKIVELIDDVELRKNIGSNGRKKVEQKFSVKANLKNYLKVFNTVTNSQ